MVGIMSVGFLSDIRSYHIADNYCLNPAVHAQSCTVSFSTHFAFCSISEVIFQGHRGSLIETWHIAWPIDFAPPVASSY